MPNLPNENTVKEDIICFRVPSGWKEELYTYVRDSDEYIDISELMRVLITREFDARDPKLRANIENLLTEFKDLAAFFRRKLTDEMAVIFDYDEERNLILFYEVLAKIQYIADDEIRRATELEEYAFDSEQT